MIKRSLFFLTIAIITSCNQNQKLPIYGERTTEEKVVDGKTIVDTIYQSIPPFSFVNQDGITITNADVKGKIYVADFFFTTCPTICPVMKKEMLRVYEKYKGNPNIMFLSHTIDPDHDTVPLLKDYAKRLGADGKQWMFLWGPKEKIYEIAGQGYYSIAKPDSTEPGGFVHSGGFILVDKQQHVRGSYDGTLAKDVDRMMEDMDLLLKEE